MEIPEHVCETMLERMKEIQLSLRDLRAELGKWKSIPLSEEDENPDHAPDPPTERQIQFLKGLGVEELPDSKVEARRLLQELNRRMENGEYAIPPTEKQITYLQDLGYDGEIPKSREEAWKLIQRLRCTR